MRMLFCLPILLCAAADCTGTGREAPACAETPRRSAVIVGIGGSSTFGAGPGSQWHSESRPHGVQRVA
jgi:hypothetical protein